MRRPWFRYFQSCFVGLVLLALAIGGTFLWRTNQAGFSGEWGKRLQQQLASYGLHAEFSSARLSLSKGLVTKDLKIYADQDRSTLLASVDRLVLDIDRSTALRGQWQIRSATFENAYLQLPNDCAPHHLSQLTGKATLCREHCLTISETNGLLGQLAIQLNASFTDFNLPDPSPEYPEAEEDDLWNEFVTALHNEISKWSAADALSPKLALTLKGSLKHTHTLGGEFRFQASRIARLRYQMNDLVLAGQLTHSSLLLEEINFKDDAGFFMGNGYYDFRGKVAHFEAESQASLERLLQLGLEINTLQKLSFTQSPRIQVQGKLQFPEGQKPELSMTGHLAVKDFHFLESSWSSLSSDFSWQKGKLYLRDLLLIHPDGQLSGKLLFQDENIRYQARSTLPARLFDPFIKPGGSIRKVLGRAKFRPDSLVTLDLTGSIRPSQLTDWTASGQVELKNFSYNNIPANYASATFNLTPLQAIYTKPEIEFDLTKDPSFLAFGGPKTAVVRADLISYENSEYLTRIEHLHGVCWPATVLRLFIPDTANYLERTYRATAPPAFSCSGVIDHVPARNLTSFHTRVKIEAPLYYDFLGKALEFRETSALIHTHHRQVDIIDLSSYTFSGPIDGDLSILLPNKAGLTPDFRGGLRWTRLRLADIGDTYGFENIEKGLVTGRLDFTGTAGKIETLNGVGNIGLEQGELFKAPVFGPLSPLIAGLQGHERTSHETARDASANFLIRKGILYTDDFITTTDSLTVEAEGSIDLARATLDMTARADTEGLLKLVTLPLNLSGFTGLFQFHGTGPISEPKWENTPFTRPKKTKKAPLFAPPPKGRVVPE